MQPYTREIVDRRSPGIRWSAVVAGTVVALGLWGVLQLLGLGAGLIAIDPDDPATARGIAVGAGAWSVLAPMLAMFAGGYVAVKLASTDEQRVAGLHGLVVWGLTSAAGLVATLWLVTTTARIVPSVDEIRRSHAATAAPSVEDRPFTLPLGPHAASAREPAVASARDVTPGEYHVLRAAEDTGKGLLALALAILLAGGAALLGALRALRDRPPVRASTAPYPLPTRARRQVTQT